MRRCAAVLAIVVTLGACSSGGRPQSGASPSGSRTAPTSTTTTAPALAPAQLYSPLPGEVEAGAKTAASTVLQRLLTFRKGEGTVAAATARLVSMPALPAVAERVAPLLEVDSAAETDIVYPQLGGFTTTKASIMTVARIRTLRGMALQSVTRTFDVRVELRQGVWTVVDIASLGGDPVPRPAVLSDPARRVLEHPGIDLPDSARWDIHAGRIADRVLVVLASIADEQPVAVTVLSSGHPIEVFGSAHVSNHIPGRAVDLWKVGVPVIDQRAPTSPLRPLLERLLRDGVTELGTPFDVDGPRGANFTNLVHQDHIHVAFDRL